MGRSSRRIFLPGGIFEGDGGGGGNRRGGDLRGRA